MSSPDFFLNYGQRYRKPEETAPTPLFNMNFLALTIYDSLPIMEESGGTPASNPWAGASLPVELFRRSGIDAVANKVLPAKGSAKGLKQGQTVESFVLLSALGGEYVDDMWPAPRK